MSRYYLDRAQLDQALQRQALPVLEALAADNNLRNGFLTRFGDDPPPYAESTESEELDNAPPPPARGELPEELQLIMDKPIRTGELDRYELESTLQPGHVYYTEAHLEELRVSRYKANSKFHGAAGSQRLGVLVRHNVKRRWEQLGVWNSEWGFPGRSVHPNDDVAGWKWPWQQHEINGPGPKNPYTQQLLARALQLRENLGRGESYLAIPRSHIKKDTSASKAESFIISRPWFIFRVEVAEERARYDRLSNEDRRRYPYSPHMQVIKRWKERGDWREEFDKTMWITSWKWGHESFPELEGMEDAPPDINDIEFTPSEIGDLATIDLPRWEQPTGFWTIKAGDLGQRNFPGQTLDPAASAKNTVQQFQQPSVPNWFPLFPRDTPPESPRPQQDTVSPPPQNSQSSDQRVPRSKINNVHNDEIRPPPRRSARIANLKRSAEPPALQAAPNKKPRGRAAPTAAASATQHSTRETRRNRAEPLRGRPSHKKPRPTIGEEDRV